MKGKLLAVSGVFALMMPTMGYAQDAPAAGDTATQRDAAAQDSGAESGIGDIVVTANRREQNLQNVGISISALSGEQMRDLNVNTALDIANATPNIEIIRSYGAERVFFGTDFPMWVPKEEMERFDALDLTDDEREMILHKNAERFFGLA